MKSNNEYSFVPYHPLHHYSVKELIDVTHSSYKECNQRRSVREFSAQPIPQEVIENLLLTAGTAPSGANKQPWTFVAVQHPEVKKQIRQAAEEEEYKSYNERMPEEWLNDLKPFGTDWQKPFLETAPWLIVVFRQNYGLESGEKKTHYYVQESVGLACGILLNAIHRAGLVALTHTPSPMNFLSKLLERPENEKPFLLIPVGYPAENTVVPDIKRKKLTEIAVFI